MTTVIPIEVIGWSWTTNDIVEQEIERIVIENANVTLPARYHVCNEVLGYCINLDSALIGALQVGCAIGILFMGYALGKLYQQNQRRKNK